VKLLLLVVLLLLLWFCVTPLFDEAAWLIVLALYDR
jgi:hypothetical protein